MNLNKTKQKKNNALTDVTQNELNYRWQNCSEKSCSIKLIPKTQSFKVKLASNLFFNELDAPDQKLKRRSPDKQTAGRSTHTSRHYKNLNQAGPHAARFTTRTSTSSPQTTNQQTGRPRTPNINVCLHVNRIT